MTDKPSKVDTEPAEGVPQPQEPQTGSHEATPETDAQINAQLGTEGHWHVSN